jgi:hypothetical protein
MQTINGTCCGAPHGPTDNSEGVYEMLKTYVSIWERPRPLQNKGYSQAVQANRASGANKIKDKRCRGARIHGDFEIEGLEITLKSVEGGMQVQTNYEKAFVKTR